MNYVTVFRKIALENFRHIERPEVVLIRALIHQHSRPVSSHRKTCKQSAGHGVLTRGEMSGSRVDSNSNYRFAFSIAGAREPDCIARCKSAASTSIDHKVDHFP